MPPFRCSSDRESCRTGVLAVDDASWWLLLSSWRWLRWSSAVGEVIWWFSCMDCMDERSVAMPGGGGGNSRPRRQLLTISSPKNEPNASTFCSDGGSSADWADGVVLLVWLWWLLLILFTEELAPDTGVDAGVWIGVEGEESGWLLWWWSVATAEGDPVTRIDYMIKRERKNKFRSDENFMFQKTNYGKSKYDKMIGLRSAWMLGVSHFQMTKKNCFFFLLMFVQYKN